MMQGKPGYGILAASVLPGGRAISGDAVAVARRSMFAVKERRW